MANGLTGNTASPSQISAVPSSSPSQQSSVSSILMTSITGSDDAHTGPTTTQQGAQL